ncbi:MAG: SAVED domain-containing protein, partial [Propionicimonas sp.]
GPVTLDLSATYAWDLAKAQVDKGLRKLRDDAQRSANPPDQVAVFALAPIPVLVYLGSRLDDKLTIQVFDHHRGRTTGAWCWGEPTGEPVLFDVHTDNVHDTTVTDVVAALSVSGTVREKNLPEPLQGFPTITLEPVGVTPQPGLVDSEATLHLAAAAWAELLGGVEALWPDAQRIHLLAAIPASLAIRVGSHRMRDAQADLVTYELTQDGYTEAITINND